MNSEPIGDSTDDTEPTVKCLCGGVNIKHSHDDRWLCYDCGRFHNARQMDRLADQARAIEVLRNANN